MDKYFKIPEELKELIRRQLDIASQQTVDDIKTNLKRSGWQQEEVITGGFFGELKHHVKGSLDNFSWRIDHYDFRKTEEKKIGGDLVITVEVIEQGHPPVTRRKTLLVQCKKSVNTHYADAALQAKKMINTSFDSRFVVFGDAGIEVYQANEVLKKSGNWNKVSQHDSFSKFLSHKVLGCQAGTRETKIEQFLAYIPSDKVDLRNLAHPKQISAPPTKDVIKLTIDKT